MKKLFLTLVMTLVVAKAMAGWAPRLKYARFMPAFAIDKAWKFSSSCNDKCNDVLKGCDTVPFPGTICWAMMSWDERTGHWDDHNMKWAEIYLIDCATPDTMIRICRVIPEGYNDDNGWKFHHFDATPNAGTTHLAHQTFRSYEDDSGFLYFMTYYSEEVRQFILRVKSKAGHKLGVRFKTEWDENTWTVYNETSQLEEQDAKFLEPLPTPSVNSAGWTVRNNKTSLQFATDAVNSSAYSLYVEESNGSRSIIDRSTGTYKYYTPVNMSQYKSNMQGAYQMNLKLYNEKTFALNTDYYEGNYSGTTTKGQRSVVTPFTTPVFIHPAKLNISNQYNGTVKIHWNVPMPNDKISYDTSPFVLQRATNAAFTTDTVSYYIPYSNVSKDFYRLDTFPHRNQGANVTFYYRIRRKNSTFDELGYQTSQKICTDYVTLTNFESHIDTAAHNVYLTWDFNNAIIEPGMKLVVSREGVAGTNFDIDINQYNRRYNGISIPECVPTTFKAHLYTTKKAIGSPKSSNTLTLQRAVSSIIDTLIASAGYYNDRVVLNWRANARFNAFNSFEVSRKEYGAPDDSKQTLDVVNYTGGVLNYSYTDYTCIPGVYYIYYIEGISTCDNQPVKVEPKLAIGFAQPFGVVSGQISFSGNQASPDVAVVANGDGHFKGKSLSFRASNKPYLVVPSRFVADMFGENQGTVEFFLRLNDMNENCTILKYDNDLVLKTYGGKLMLDIKDNAGTTHTITADSVKNDGMFKHVAITYNTQSGTRKCILYINGDPVGSVSFNSANSYAIINDVSGSLLIGSDGANSYMNGNIDEIRFWNIERIADKIKNSSSAYLSGSETGLTGYYRCDDNVDFLLFDLSKTGNAFNGHHLYIEGIPVDSTMVPTAEQLSFKTYTDANGHYLFNNIPFSSKGTLYTITPVLGVHEFNPTSRPIYFGADAAIHNSIDFTDVSSFEVSGTVYYYNTNYPVEGCTFTVDGTSPCMKDGELIETDANGRFTIQVPIGKHFIKVAKEGHTFANGGKYPASGLFEFDRPINSLVLNDSTFVLVTGRVAGGSDEKDKPHGFGAGKANIGKAKVVISPVGSIYNLNRDESKSRTFTMPDSLTDICHSIATTGPAVGNSAKSITIYTDSATGEFNVLLPPVNFAVSSVNIVNNLGNIHFTSSALPAINLSGNDVQALTTDSITKDGTHYSYFKYAKALDVIYYSFPELSLVQNSLEGKAIGSKYYYYSDNSTGVTIKDTIPLYNTVNDTIRYTFGHPCFFQGDVHTWQISVAEKYVNYDVKNHPDTTCQPFKYGVVNVDNNFATQVKNGAALMDTSLILSDSKVVTVSGAEMLLDSTGKTYYSFCVGDPVVFSPYTATANITFMDSERTREYDWNGNKNNQVIVFGSKIKGSKIITKGPEEIFYILRDPVGSKSYATWAAGEKSVKTIVNSYGWQEEFNYEALIKTTIKTTKVLAPTGLGVSSNFTESNIWAGLTCHEEHQGEKYDVDTWIFTNQQTISTSSDPAMVGSCADVFIGNGTNIVYGEADNVALLRDTAGHYSVGKKDAISVSSEFTTQFNYTQYYIETFLIPDTRRLRNSLLVTVPVSQYDTSYVNTTGNAIYITTLSSSDPNFGEDSTYLMILPRNLSSKKVYIDEVKNSNIQIKRWIDAMADNEHAKVIVHHSNTPFNKNQWESIVLGGVSKSGLFNNKIFDLKIDSTFNAINAVAKQYTGGWLIGNYSVGAGAPFSQSQTLEYSNVSNGKKTSTSFLIGPKFKNAYGITVVALDNEISLTFGGVYSTDASTENTNSSTVSYSVLMDDYEALSFDVYQAPDGYGPIFCTRGGQTFCPYQDAEYTKYYEPELHELQTRTGAMATPKITAANKRVVNVPVGQKAIFNISLGNEASTTPQIDFRLCEDVSTNPNGAMLKMDGAPVTYNGLIVPLAGGEQTNKVIELQQTREDILDYDSIALIFKTDCYKFDADTIYISAHFVPTCSDINLSVDKHVLNNTTDTTVNFTIDGYTPDFRNLRGIQLQFQREGSYVWNILKEYTMVADSVMISSGTLRFSQKLKFPEYPEGVYKFRAVTLCQNGHETINNESEIVDVTVDLTVPATLGTPYPVDGIYSSSSQIYAEFSEPIQTGLVLDDNVQVKGVLNYHRIKHGITLDLENNPVYSSATYNLDSIPFSLEMWLNYSNPGTIFSFANANSKGISFAIDNDNKLKATVNGQNFVSNNVLQPNEWCYLLIQCDPVNHTLNATYAYGDHVDTLFLNRHIPAVTTKGNIHFGGGGIKAKIHDVALWSTIRPWATALAERNESKSPYTPDIISLWHMDEGTGFKAEDCIRHRDLVLTAEAWAYNYSNYALHIPAGKTASVNISECPIPDAHSYLFEFWFRAKGDAHLFHLANDSISVSIQNKKLTFGSGFTYPIRNYTDSTWHHFALIYKNTASPMIAIDGVQLSSYTLLDLPNFQSSAVVFGTANGTTRDIDIDEIRLWNINTSLEAVRQYRNTCLTGEEDGLLAYYPMEHTITDVYNQQVTEFTLQEKSATGSAPKSIVYSDTLPAQSTTAPALVESRPVENVAHTFTASEDRVVINVTEPAARIEGCTLEFLIKDVVDKNGNYAQPIRWTAFVNRNQLLWDEDVINIVKNELVDTTFYVTVINSGSQAKSWTIDNVPSWLKLSASAGYLQPLQHQTISCTINSSLGRGDNEHILYLSSDDEIERPLYINTRVIANKPNWVVNSDNYYRSMNLITCAEINGVMADDSEDMVAAFIGNELVGVANLQLFPAIGRYYAMMTIYPGSSSANQITFRYWDASNGTVYNNIAIHCWSSAGKDSVISYFTYSDETICGDINSPYLLTMGTEIEQSINMHKGWNWISVNVVANNPTVKSVFKNYISEFAIIKDQKAYSQTDTIQKVVKGPLDTVFCGKGYRINALKNFTAKVTGTPAPINTTVNLAPASWTWIGYVPQTAMTVNAALSNINPSTGDLIKSQQKFATWDGAQWIGTLAVMEPGVGYSYKNTGTEAISFSYPDYNAFSYNMPARMPEEVEDTYFEPVDPGKYQGNMTMTAVVSVDGQNVEGAEVAVFAGAECRAASTCHEGYYFLTIPGESATPLSIKVVYNDSVYAIAEGFTFQNDSAIGNLYEPYVISVRTGATPVVNVNASASDKVEKVLINDDVFIIRNGEYYDALGRPRNKPEDRKK